VKAKGVLSPINQFQHSEDYLPAAGRPAAGYPKGVLSPVNQFQHSEDYLPTHGRPWAGYPKGVLSPVNQFQLSDWSRTSVSSEGQGGSKAYQAIFAAGRPVANYPKCIMNS